MKFASLKVSKWRRGQSQGQRRRRKGADRQTDSLHRSLFQLMSQWNERTQQVSLKPPTVGHPAVDWLVCGLWEELGYWRWLTENDLCVFWPTEVIICCCTEGSQRASLDCCSLCPFIMNWADVNRAIQRLRKPVDNCQSK